MTEALGQETPLTFSVPFPPGSTSGGFDMGIDFITNPDEAKTDMDPTPHVRVQIPETFMPNGPETFQFRTTNDVGSVPVQRKFKVCFQNVPLKAHDNFSASEQAQD